MTPEQSALLRKAAVGQHFIKTGRVPVEFHRFLIKAEDNRKVGDYDIGPGLNEAQTTEQIERARQFLKLAERLIGSFPLSETEDVG